MRSLVVTATNICPYVSVILTYSLLHPMMQVMSQRKFCALASRINYWGYYLYYNNTQLSTLKTGTIYKRHYAHMEKILLLPVVFFQWCNY